MQENIHLAARQSGLMPCDSTVNQLTFLSNIFCQALDASREIRVVFSSISKAFDRVWHAGLIRKPSNYILRNSYSLRPVAKRSNLYLLPVVVRQLDSVSSFKKYVDRDFAPVPKYYLTDIRK